MTITTHTLLIGLATGYGLRQLGRIANALTDIHRNSRVLAAVAEHQAVALEREFRAMDRAQADREVGR